MSKSTAVIALSERPTFNSPTCGILVAITESGEPLVQVLGTKEPIKVRTAISFRNESEARQFLGKTVLVCFTDDEPVAGIIVGFVAESMWDEMSLPMFENRHVALESMVDARRIEITAQEELVLQCGKGKIQLKNDGTVIVRGKKITSRSKEAHKIRGSSVNIN